MMNEELLEDYLGEEVNTPGGVMTCTGVHVLEGEILIYFEDSQEVAQAYYLTEFLQHVEN
jgi:hypothetical protein